MRRYKVEIVQGGRVVHSCVVSATTSSEAMDEAWRAYDKDQVIGRHDPAYATTTEEL